MSVVLIRPPAVLPFTARNAVTEIPPIGLAYLAAALQRAGHRAHIIDAFGEAPGRLSHHGGEFTTNGLVSSEIVDRIPPGVDLIGVTCMFSNAWLYCRSTIAAIHARFPLVPIVVGGEHATADHDRLLRRVPEVACCALGEGEDTLVDIAARVADGRDLSDVPGIALRDRDGRVVTTPPRPRIVAIDELPWPDWSTVPLQNYHANELCCDPYVGASMPLIASRGCPFQCTFCSSPQMLGTKWVARDPAKVVDEMRHYRDAYGVRYFEFQDLTMIVRKDWILDFTRHLKAAGLDVGWCMPSGTRSEALDGPVLSSMRESGCRSFCYAAESGSADELARIKKKVSVPRMLESMRHAVKAGMVTKCHLIFGLPDQTKRDVLRTLGFVTRMAWTGVNDLGCYAFSPYPGSALYDRLVREGRIDPESDDYDRVLAHNVFTNYRLRRSWTPHIPAWSLSGLCFGTMAYFYALQFLLRPRRLVPSIRNALRGRPETYLQRMLTETIRRLRRRWRRVQPPAVAAATARPG